MESLIEAAIHGNSPRLRKILEQGAHPDLKDQHGETALNWAAYLGHTSVVKDLLAAGANREIRGNFLRVPPLLLAAHRGHRGAVALLAVFADLGARDARGASALMLALEPGTAIEKPQPRILGTLQALIQAGIDLDLQDQNGNTALIWAVESGNLEAVRLFLEAGANANITNKADQTALQVAVNSGNTRLIQLLGG